MIYKNNFKQNIAILLRFFFMTVSLTKAQETKLYSILDSSFYTIVDIYYLKVLAFQFSINNN